MNFDSNDHPLSKEYQNRMQRQTEQARLAEQSRRDDGDMPAAALQPNRLPRLHLRTVTDAAFHILRNGFAQSAPPQPGHLDRV